MPDTLPYPGDPELNLNNSTLKKSHHGVSPIHSYGLPSDKRCSRAGQERKHCCKKGHNHSKRRFNSWVASIDYRTYSAEKCKEALLCQPSRPSELLHSILVLYQCSSKTKNYIRNQQNKNYIRNQVSLWGQNKKRNTCVTNSASTREGVPCITRRLARRYVTAPDLQDLGKSMQPQEREHMHTMRTDRQDTDYICSLPATSSGVPMRRKGVRERTSFLNSSFWRTCACQQVRSD